MSRSSRQRNHRGLSKHRIAKGGSGAAWERDGRVSRAIAAGAGQFDSSGSRSRCFWYVPFNMPTYPGYQATF